MVSFVLLAQVPLAALLLLLSCSTSAAPIQSRDLRFWRDSRETNEYEVCSFVDVPDSILSGTTVIFKFPALNNSIWHIQKLINFKDKFHNAGYTSASFVAVINDDSYYDAMEVEDILFVSEMENEVLKVMQNNSVLVVDQCKNVVYAIYPPWTSLVFPYVKAAILSTLFDHPCGPCENMQPNNESSSVHPLYQQNTEEPRRDKTDYEYDREKHPDIRHFPKLDLSEEYNSSVSDDADAGYLIPMKIILPVEHMHHADDNSTYTKYNYIVLMMENETYHEHLASDPGEILEIDQSQLPTTTPQTFIEVESMEDRPTFLSMLNNSLERRFEMDEAEPNSGEELIFLDQQLNTYKKGKAYSVKVNDGNDTEDFDELVPVYNKVLAFVNVMESSTSDYIPQEIDNHYSLLLPWLDFLL